MFSFLKMNVVPLIAMLILFAASVGQEPCAPDILLKSRNPRRRNFGLLSLRIMSAFCLQYPS